MEGHHPHPLIHLQQQLQHPPPPHLHQSLAVTADQSAAAADRFPQWSIQETKEFLMIRAELDQTFMETKRNKVLWEITASKMKEKGFNRSAEQCKCKWKNLVTRYKGCDTMEPEISRQQFPFYTELEAIFGARMQRLWAEAESGGSGSKKKMMALSSDEDEENEDSDGDGGDGKVGNNRKRKKGKANVGASSGGGSSSVNHLKEILEDFMNQQMQMEVQWREAFEAREKERQMREMEWRRNMEALEHERIMLERRWREREEQRRMREELRAEKRDALITALLNKLRRDDHHM